MDPAVACFAPRTSAVCRLPFETVGFGAAASEDGLIFLVIGASWRPYRQRFLQQQAGDAASVSQLNDHSLPILVDGERQPAAAVCSAAARSQAMSCRPARGARVGPPLQRVVADEQVLVQLVRCLVQRFGQPAGSVHRICRRPIPPHARHRLPALGWVPLRRPGRRGRRSGAC